PRRCAARRVERSSPRSGTGKAGTSAPGELRQAYAHIGFRWMGDTCIVRILVVDDERPVREALERALRLEGYEVETVADGQEALFALARRGVDAIVLDVLMPV